MTGRGSVRDRLTASLLPSADAGHKDVSHDLGSGFSSFIAPVLPAQRGPVDFTSRHALPAPPS